MTTAKPPSFYLTHGKCLLIDLEQKVTGNSWLLSRCLGESTPKHLAVFLYLIAAILFTVTGVGYYLGKAWFINTMLISTIFSSLLIITFFDGKFELLVQKGLVGLIINIALLAWVLVEKSV